MSLNGEKISTTNASFAKKHGLLSTTNTNFANKTGLACQGNYYKDNPSGIDDANEKAGDVAELKRIVASSSEFRLFGKIACDFFIFDKHLISGVTVRLFLRRSPNDFFIMSEQPYKHYRVQITEANLNVRKMTVTYFVLTVIEKTVENTGNVQLN